MTVFKYVLRLAWRFKAVVISYTAIFVIFAYISSSRMAGQQIATYRDIKEDVVVVMPAESNEWSDLFLRYLSERHHVDVTTENEEQLRVRLAQRQYEGAVILYDNLEERLDNKQPIARFVATEDQQSRLFEQLVHQYAVVVQAGRQGGMTPAQLEAVLKEEASVTVAQESGTTSSISMVMRTYFSGVNYAILTVFITLVFQLTSGFRARHIQQRLNISGKKQRDIRLQQYGAVWLVLSLVTVVFAGICVVLQPSSLTEPGFIKHVVVLYVTGLSVAAMAFLIATLTEAYPKVVNSISTVMSLGLSFFSGVFIPTALLPEGVVTVAKAFPIYYAVDAHGAPETSVLAVLPQIGIMLLFTVFYLVLALAVSRSRMATEGH